MKRRIKALVVVVLVVGAAHGLAPAYAVSSDAADKISLKGEIVEDAAFPVATLAQ